MKRFDEAIVAAQEVATLTAQAFGNTSLENLRPLENLAAVQLARGDLPAAATSYQAAVTLIERNSGILSPRLVKPLLGLGETFNKAGLYPQAKTAYERALQVNHANQGFYNLEQMPIHDGLSEAYLGLNKPEQAEFHQETQVAIASHRVGDGSPELVPPLSKLAAWYVRNGSPDAAQLTYEAAIGILEKARGKNDPALVDILIGAAQIFRNQAYIGQNVSDQFVTGWGCTREVLRDGTIRERCPSGDVHYLKRALEVLQAQSSADPAKRAEVLVALGDSYMAAGKPRSAREDYVQAWRELSADPALEMKRDGYFQHPALVGGPPFRTLTREAAALVAKHKQADLPAGSVVARLVVDEEGHARDPAPCRSRTPRA